MKKKAVKNQIVEHLSRLGDASVHQVGSTDDVLARVYHYHNTLEVMIIKQGWIEGLVGGVMGRLTEGMTLVLGNDVPHCVFRASDDSEAVIVHIPSDLLKWDEKRFPELAHGIGYIRKSKSGMVYDDISFAKRTARLAGKIASADGFLRMSLIMRLLHLLSTTPPVSTLLTDVHCANVCKEKEAAIDRAYRYLYEHFREPFSLNDIAAYAGLNNTALCRSFKKSSGCTIWQFCSRLRIEHACNLLLTTNMDVSQIAYTCGYNSYPHFCTQFKNATKMSPSAYRGKGELITAPQSASRRGCDCPRQGEE